MTPYDFEILSQSWYVHLRSRGLSPRTLRCYQAGLGRFSAWCADGGLDPDLGRRSAEAFTASLLAGGSSSGTAALRLIALRQFSAWLAAEGEIERDEIATMKSPKTDQKVVEHLTADELTALLRACMGQRFTALRDTALVRFMHSTGARADEIVSMKLYDVQLGARSAVIVRGKGGKGRRSGYGDKTAEALGRYLRARRKHPNAELEAFWLAGSNGRRSDGSGRGNMTYDGLVSALGRRAEAAGIGHFHLHRLRHTAAVDWLRRGGTVSGLMAQMGWESVEMVRRYVKAAEADLAVAESHRLSIDEF